MTTEAPPSRQQPDVVPSEVGWQFVPQYYTFVNKEPKRLHCFYNKDSTFIHGTEGEDGRACHGQQEIHKKILSIGFQDCKVFIHSVDAQSSSHGGIIVQVIGEMSNNNEPWRKFVQTFFLAPQPNGYFVLNDIFRFLKEESPEAEDASDTGVPVGNTPSIATPAPVLSMQTPEFQAPETVTPPPLPVADVEPTTTIPEPAPLPTPEQSKTQLNGFHPEPEPEPEHVDIPPTQDVEPPVTVEEPVREESPVPPAPEEPPAPPAPTPAAAAPPPPAAQSPLPLPTTIAPAQPTPAPARAPATATPKTWANLAAANSTKWGPAVAQEARGTSEAPPPSPVINNINVNSGASAPNSGAQTPAGGGPAGRPHPGQGQGGPRPPGGAYLAAQAITTPSCFVKAVTENISQTQLTQVLTTRFGPIKDIDVVRSKACAFLEFTTVDAARRAIIASLPLGQGGEGGIRFEVSSPEGPTQVRISVETKKERGERPPPRPRGGAPPNGDVRGGFRGGRGGGGGGGDRGGRGGRGGPPPPSK